MLITIVIPLIMVMGNVGYSIHCFNTNALNNVWCVYNIIIMFI
jgi:hypothetical protein